MSLPIVRFLALALGLAAGVHASPPAGSRLVLSPCRVEHPTRITMTEAECGTLRVSENPADPQGRHIALHVARVPAISRRKEPDPLFVLAGGPGMAATAFYASAAPAFARIRRNRDIVLVDQRGTGGSSPLTCDFDEDLLMRATGSALIAETRRCLTELAQHADVAFYTTSLAVQDLDRVRAALGYEKVNLYGASYGTRVAQHYLRRFPQRVRSMILDGVVPPGLALGPALALDAEAALASILDRCKEEPACRERFGDPAATYRALRQSLQARPVTVSLPDPTTGEQTTVEFTTYHLATVLRLASYTPEQAALLPLALHVAHRSGDFAPLAARFLIVSRSYDDLLAYGMHNTVVCSEDVPFYRLSSIDRAELERTYLGTAQLDALLDVCSVWPKGPVDPDFHAPLQSDVPVLLLSGTDDPVTPPAYAEQARTGLTSSLHIRMQGFGHGQLGAPCMDRVMARFIDQGSVAGLDVSCTRLARPMPFFTSPAGPTP